jgi:Zn-dependent protease
MNNRYKFHNNYNFSRKEIFDLSKSFIAIGLAFTFFYGGVNLNNNFFYLLIISLLTAGIGFLLHELMHKFTAQYYKCWSEFRSDDNMLIMGILASFAGFILLAPGAVLIHGNINQRQNGIISAAGPFTNIVIAVFFYLIMLLDINNIISLIGTLGFKINSWLALFNLIPVWQFDGAKIFRWNKKTYFLMAIISIILVLFLP